MLVIGWGSTYGPIGAGVRRVRKAGYQVAQVHLRHLNPFPKDLGEILKRYDKVLVPEMNLGQLSLLLRGKYLVDAIGYNHVRGLPLKAAELAEAIGGLVAEAEGIEVDLTTTTSQEALHEPTHHHRARPARPRLRRRGRPDATTGQQTAKEYTSDQEVRWCPGCGDYAVLKAVQWLPAPARAAPGEHRLRLRHRLLLAVPLLPRHLRHALDPRPRAVDRDRHRHRARGPLGVGRHR